MEEVSLHLEELLTFHVHDTIGLLQTARDQRVD